MKLERAPGEFRRRGEGVQAVIKRALLSAARRGVTDIVSNIIPSTVIEGRSAPPVDRGPYKAGFRASPTMNGARIHHIIPTLAAIMEFGVRAGNVKIGRKMIKELSAWVHRHSLENEKESSEQIAWAIAKTMQRKGMAPRRVMEREKPRVAQFAKEEIERMLAKHLRGGKAE